MNIVDIGTHLEHQGFSDDEIDEYLEHFGVKGMKWGTRRAQAKEYKTKRDRQIDRARANVYGGTTDRRYKAAKQKYKEDAPIIGRKAAKDALKQAKAKRSSDIKTSYQAKSGREHASAILMKTAFGLSILAVGVAAYGSDPKRAAKFDRAVQNVVDKRSRDNNAMSKINQLVKDADSHMNNAVSQIRQAKG